MDVTNSAFFTKKIIFILGPFFALSLSSCAPFISRPTSMASATLEAFLTDRSVLTDKPCIAPCWYGLIPGESTQAEIVKTVQQLSFIDSSQIYEMAIGYWDEATQQNSPATLLSLRCKQPGQQTCATFIIKDDTLRVIELDLNYPLNFGDVVEHLGTPDYVRVVPNSPENSGCSAIGLVWIDQNVIANHDTSDSTESQKLCDTATMGKILYSTLSVSTIQYLQPNDIQLIAAKRANLVWPGLTKP